MTYLQLVAVGKKTPPDPASVFCGVLQGGICGPLFVLCHVNDNTEDCIILF